MSLLTTAYIGSPTPATEYDPITGGSEPQHGKPRYSNIKATEGVCDIGCMISLTTRENLLLVSS